MTTLATHAAVRRDAVKRLVDEQIAPHAGEWDRTERIPRGVLEALSAVGLWGAVLPAEAGGIGVGLQALGGLHEEVGRGCSSVRSLLTVHTMVTWAVHRWGGQELQERWLPRLADGTALGAFCLSEPGVGSDAAAVASTATRTADGWTLSGHKKWITGGQLADVFLVFARTGTELSAFVVPRTAPGVTVTPLRGMLGTRAAMLAEVILRDVRLRPDSLIGPEGFAGSMVMTGALGLGRHSVASGCVGIAQACLEASARHTSQRSVAGGALREKQLIRAKITDMVTHTQAARLLCERAGRLLEVGSPDAVMATWIAKYFAAAAAATISRDAVQIHGAAGCSPEHPVERHYRDAKVMEIIEGSTEIQQQYIAEEAYRTLPLSSHDPLEQR